MSDKSPQKKKKILTGIRMDPDLKSAAVIAAGRQNRSLSNYLENLVLEDVVNKGLFKKS
jgi:predicted HicB family RNase H-like nuclease